MCAQLLYLLLLFSASIDGLSPQAQQKQEEFLQRDGLPQEEFDYVQSKLKELNILIGKSVGVKKPTGRDDEKHNRQFRKGKKSRAEDRGEEDTILYTREQIDFIINDYKKRLGQKPIVSDEVLQNSAVKKRPERRRKPSKKGNKQRTRGKRKIVDFKRFPANKWIPPIPYIIHGSFPNFKQKMIFEAIDHWERKTCIKFQRIEKTDEAVVFSHLLFSNADNKCNSYAGKVKLGRKDDCGICDCLSCDNCTCPQPISGGGCQSTGQFIHEIGHAIGFVHEHSRADRDDFVTIKEQNIGEADRFNFENSDKERRHIPYDYTSIMHYSPYGFALDATKKTIEVKKSLYQNSIGQRIALSFYDVKTANLDYCKDKCRPLNCARGGIVNPNKCTECICPDGFGGKLCENVAQSSASCSHEDIFLDHTREMCTNISPKSGGLFQCNLRIHTTAGWKIQVLNHTISISVCGNGQCCENWKEIKYQGNLEAPGPRFCGRSSSTVQLLSDNNEVMVLLRNNVASSQRKVLLCYKAVGTTTSTTQLSRGEFVEFPNSICDGHTIPQSYTIPSLEACKRKCENMCQCNAISYSQSKKKCFLKTSCPIRNGNQLFNSYLLIADEYQKFEKNWCPYNDLPGMPLKRSFHDCKMRCSNTCSCVAFTYRNNSLCWLKTKCEPTDDPQKTTDVYLKNKLGTTTSTTQLSRDSHEIMPGTDCFGNDIESGSFSSVADCKIKCGGMYGCVAVVHDAKTKYCWFKRVCESMSTHLKLDIYFRNPGSYKVHRNKNCFGNDIRDEQNDNVADCLIKCDVMQECVAILYDNIEKRCWFKRRCATRTDAKGDIYVKGDAYNVFKKKDCIGNDIQTGSFAHVVPCHRKCEVIQGCVAVVYRPSWNTCWFKRICDSRTDNEFQSIHIRSDGYKVTRNTDCFSNDIQHEKVDNVADCLIKCNSIQGCVAVVHKQSTRDCWFKRLCVTRREFDSNLYLK